LNSLDKLVDTKIIFTRPNSDTNGRIINEYIDNFVNNNPQRSIAYTSMGQKNYLSALNIVDAVVGNSSSGLLEAPTFKIGTINIGDRQKGRLKADSVIDCDAKRESISLAISKVYSSYFQNKLKSITNPYGEGFASEKIIKILANEPIPLELKKKFYDL
jgi:GDP/UDP-N,N'-diacetylbacillosamine 2-epimerase (hydrolysing)